MSGNNSKKIQNYSSILGDLRGSLNDKVKGRNYKMYMKRIPTNSTDKSEISGLKSIHTTTVNDKIVNEHRASLVDRKSAEKKRVIHSVTNDYNQKRHDCNLTEQPESDKIDIKISVNYSKPTINNINISKSKSFYGNNSNNGMTIPHQNDQTVEYMNSYADDTYTKNETMSVKEKMIKNMKNSEETILRKKVINSKEIASSYKNHNRNQSESNFSHHNLDVSLTNQDQNRQRNNYYNSKNVNNSFAYNPQLYKQFKTTVATSKQDTDQTGMSTSNIVLLEGGTIEKNETIENPNPSSLISNLKDFTLNRNDDYFLQMTESVQTEIDQKNQISQIEAKMDDMLFQCTSETDKMMFLTKKFSTYKKALEDFNRINSKNSSFLEKINNGYSEVMQAMMINYTKLHDKLIDYDSITSSNL